MPKKEKKVIPEDQLILYKQVVNTIPEMEIKSSFGFPYTSLNGHMFSLLSKSGLVGIRLPKEEREAFLSKYDSVLYQPEPGPLLKEYVTVPKSLLADSDTLKLYLEMSLEYVKSLKPKPPKKAKSK